MTFKIDELRFDEKGLIPAIVQDARTREVLTLAYMNRESLERTIGERETWFWSRSRSSLWHKGETSGNTQRVIEMRPDCDGDAILVLVEPRGPACHTGARSCFSPLAAAPETASTDGSEKSLGPVLEELHKVIEARRREMPENSYTTYLFSQGLDKILKKLGEEASETIIAAKNGDLAPLASESSDLLYHLLVLLVERGLALDLVAAELSRRRREAK